MRKFWPEKEFDLRVSRLQKLIVANGFNAVLVSTNANIYYLSGQVFAGYVYVPAEGRALFFVQRPVGLEGDSRVVYIRKPETIVEELDKLGMQRPEKVAFELDRIPYSQALRLAKAFSQESLLNASPVLSAVRSVKTDYEVDLIRKSGLRHCGSYGRISGLYREGMTDIELQIEMERVLRLDGCLGIFRIAGESMETFMGSLLAGKNAACPSPYDFSLGGEGLDGSLPVSSNGEVILPGNTVMFDMNGDFTGYMTDMSRTFYVKTVSDKARQAHQVSIDIHKALATFIKPGVAAKDAYNLAFDMAKAAGLEEYFMGYHQKSGFIGHGVGIEINEQPVLAPRSKSVFEEGNVIAIEPKFVIPEVGAAGIENTYLVTSEGLECLTVFPEELAEL